MPAPSIVTILMLSTLLSGSAAHPWVNSPKAVRADSSQNFIIGTMGDSWGSGVSYSTDTQYDDDQDCLRYKYAWSTVVNDMFPLWTPNRDLKSELEFRACSGAHLDNMKEQMDKMSRPKLVIMEAGGNNANFYPLADACLFHSEYKKDYGKKYEDDDPNDIQGECRREIKLVRERLTGQNMEDLQKTIRETIHTWRGHPSVMNNEATLVTLGYGQFFAMDEQCNGWDFCVPWSEKSHRQNVTLEMRKEINGLIGYMNTTIREATESFNDRKIHFIDINPAFDGHRFCEAGDSIWDQLNYGDKVWIWNNPAKWWPIMSKGIEIKEYKSEEPPKPDFNRLYQHRDEPVVLDGEYANVTFTLPDNPEINMVWRGKPVDEINVANGGSIARTLHPKQSGHKAMAEIIVERLRQIYSIEGGCDAAGSDCKED